MNGRPANADTVHLGRSSRQRSCRIAGRRLVPMNNSNSQFRRCCGHILVRQMAGQKPHALGSAQGNATDRGRPPQVLEAPTSRGTSPARIAPCQRRELVLRWAVADCKLEPLAARHTSLLRAGCTTATVRNSDNNNRNYSNQSVLQYRRPTRSQLRAANLYSPPEPQLFPPFHALTSAQRSRSRILLRSGTGTLLTPRPTV